MSELQLRLDSVKQEAGVNKVKLQALVADWDQVQAEGGAKSLSAGKLFSPLKYATLPQNQSRYQPKNMFSCFPPADAELKRKVECMHEGQAKLALLKNQTQEAEAALAGGCFSSNAFISETFFFGFILLYLNPQPWKLKLQLKAARMLL